MKFDTNKHSVFRLNYCLVLTIKFRRKVINGDISARLRVIFENISPKYLITLEQWNYDKDNVYCCFKSAPNSEISKFINAYKSASSRLIKKEFPCIKEHLWENSFWNKSYCLFTITEKINELNVKIIENYISSQLEK